MGTRDCCRILLLGLMLAATGLSAADATTSCVIVFQSISGWPPQLLHRLEESESHNSTSADRGWRLVRIPNPRGGRDTFSIMHSVDISRSDVDLAGIALRCTTAPEVDTIVVGFEPWPLDSHPKVTLRIGSKSAAGEAAAGTTVKCFTTCKAIPGGAAQPPFHRVADPQTLDSPAAGGWRLVRIRNPRRGPDTFSIMHSADVSRSDPAGLVLRCQTAPDVDTIVMVIEPWPDGNKAMNGTVPIGGLGPAFNDLLKSCPLP
jgi:hypothetical protein